MRVMRYPNILLSRLIILTAAFLGGALKAAHHNELQLPPGFEATVIADEIGPARALAVRENGDIYVSLLRDVDLNYLCAMRDTDGDGVMDLIKYFGEVGSLVKSIKLYGDYLYVGATTQVVRYPLSDDELLPTGTFEVIVNGFPTPRSHRSKNIDFDDDGNLYVSAGAPSNSCQEVDRTTNSPGKVPCEELAWGAGVWKFDANRPNQKHLKDGELIATGIRNAVAIQWDSDKGELYTVSNGRDGLNQNWGQFFNERESAEKPAEEFHMVRKGQDYGWPYAYWDHERNDHMLNPEYGGDGTIPAEEGLYDDPIYAFPGHWAPVGLQFYHGEQFPEKYRGGAFVAFHGSWNRAPLPQQGYNVVFVPFDGKYPSGEYEEFAEGFKGTDMLMTPSSATYRPTGLAVGPDGSLYISEDRTGRIWKVQYTGNIQKPSAAATKPTTRTTTATQEVAFNPRGMELYNQYCLACHQLDGSGVPNMQPSLLESAKLKNDPDHIIRLMLQGSDWIENREYTNIMTTFAYLSDEAIAIVINYSKARFAHMQPDITAEQVAAMRATLP